MKYAPCFFLALILAGCSLQKGSRSGPPTQAQIEEGWREAANLSEGHMRIAPLVGVWDAEMKAWMNPNETPDVTRAVSRDNWILGKLFIEEQFATTMMGQPFVGRGLFGFNNTTKLYESTWADSMSSSQIHSTGTFDPVTNSILLQGRYVDPVTKDPKSTRSILHFIDNDHYTFEMYDTDYTGKEYKALEIAYGRRGEKTAGKPAANSAARAAAPAEVKNSPATIGKTHAAVAAKKKAAPAAHKKLKKHKN